MRILLVEDEPRLARSYRRNLEDEGHEVETLGDGDVALARILQDADSFDVIILDVLLPGRDGVTVCREARRAGISTPVLLLTALDQTEQKVAGLDAGADDYLTKPFPFDELFARLRALGRRSRVYQAEGSAGQIVVGDLIVDPSRHEVYRDGELILLTAREFALLEVLARNAGRVMTRAQLTDRVWPDGTEAGSNVLETYIHYLRDKLERDVNDRLISTMRGVGYILRPARAEGDRA